jgi:hypothetical protein
MKVNMKEVIKENLFSNITSSSVLLRKLLAGVQLLRQWRAREMFTVNIYSEGNQLLAGRSQSYAEDINSDLVIIDGDARIRNLTCEILVVSPGSAVHIDGSLVVKHAGLIHGASMQLNKVDWTRVFVKDTTLISNENAIDDRSSDIEPSEIRNFVRLAYVGCFGSKQVEVPMLHDDEREDLERIPASLLTPILHLYSQEPGLDDVKKRDALAKLITLSYSNPRVREDLRLLIEEYRAGLYTSGSEADFTKSGVFRRRLTKTAAEEKMLAFLEKGWEDQRIASALLVDVSVVQKYRKRYERAKRRR